MDPTFIKGFAAVATSVVVLIGSVWLLLSLILGVKMGYFVTAVSFFGIMVLLSGIWIITALGPKGPETTWHPIAVGASLSSLESAYGTFDVSDYPGGDWQLPSPKVKLADLGKKESTQAEFENAKPVMDALVGSAVSPIPGKRKEVEAEVLGAVDLEPGKFQLINFRIKEATVDGKESLIAVGTAVSSEHLTAGTITESVVKKFLVAPGAKVAKGDAVVAVASGPDVVADKAGVIISFGLREEDKIKTGIPFATIDVTGQPGAADVAQVAAVRVRGGVRIPSLYYLIASLALFALHMLGMRNAERSKANETATA